MKRFLILGLLALIPSVLWAEIDPYDLLPSLLDSTQHPRVLNTEDFLNLKMNEAQTLFFPEGDFNGDGLPDIAISGVYDLPKDKNRYFFLVGTLLKDPARAKSFYLKTSDIPVFIHMPGTTGEGDPGNQAFSISYCWECDKGDDFYWNKRSQKFDTKNWTMHVRKEKKMVEVAADVLPEDAIDASLKIVGILPDVQSYVGEIKKRNGDIGTRVEWDKGGAKKRRTIVSIFEKKKLEDGKTEMEVPYDRVTVDLDRKKIMKRTLKAPKTSR